MIKNTVNKLQFILQPSKTVLKKGNTNYNLTIKIGKDIYIFLIKIILNIYISSVTNRNKLWYSDSSYNICYNEIKCFQIIIMGTSYHSFANKTCRHLEARSQFSSPVSCQLVSSPPFKRVLMSGIFFLTVSCARIVARAGHLR